MNRLVVYSLPIAISSITGNNTMDLLYLLKENFKNLLLDLLIIRRSFENLSYLSVLTKVRKELKQPETIYNELKSSKKSSKPSEEQAKRT